MYKSFDPIDILFIVLIGTYLFFFVMLIIYLLARRIEDTKVVIKGKKKQTPITQVKAIEVTPIEPIKPKPSIEVPKQLKSNVNTTNKKKNVDKSKVTNKNLTVQKINNKTTSKKKNVNKTTLINKDKLNNTNKQKVANNKKPAPKNNSSRKTSGYVNPTKKRTTTKKKGKTNYKKKK